MHFDSQEKRSLDIRTLLAGEPLIAELEYDLNHVHVGAAASGDTSEDVLQKIASSLDLHLLLVQGDRSCVWAWLGARSRPNISAIAKYAATNCPAGVQLALGEPNAGVAGWRATHRQAVAAHEVGEQLGRTVVRYVDVALLSAIVRDEVLTRSLRELFVAPLLESARGWELLRTLSAYFRAERHVSSAAASLGVTRHTVTNRLRAAEAHLNLSLTKYATEMEIALRMECELNHSGA